MLKILLYSLWVFDDDDDEKDTKVVGNRTFLYVGLGVFLGFWFMLWWLGLTTQNSNNDEKCSSSANSDSLFLWVRIKWWTDLP